LEGKGESPQVEARVASILIVDDEALVRSMTRTALERAGHRVADAANGAEALALLDRESFDLAVIDLIMPEKEGIETIVQIRERGYGLKIIAASGGGAARLDLLPIARKAGADYTIGKPFNSPDLLALVQRALAV
jgi:CheY-like chemotaxis protein